jgi:hypothetical protein
MVELWHLVILGALGGFARHIVGSKGKVVLPHLDVEDTEIILNLGVLLNMILGALFGLLVPYGLGSLIRVFVPNFPVMNDYLTALFAGGLSVDIFENAIEWIHNIIQSRKAEQEATPLTRTGIPT